MNMIMKKDDAHCGAANGEHPVGSLAPDSLISSVSREEPRFARFRLSENSPSLFSHSASDHTAGSAYLLACSSRKDPPSTLLPLVKKGADRGLLPSSRSHSTPAEGVSAALS
jgi:hypothetical protein